jgi:hypothetical protein
MMDVQVAEPTRSHYKNYPPPKALNQNLAKKKSSCVGHAAHQHLRCGPVRNIVNIPDPIKLYDEAQLLDEWSGVDPEVEGTSIRAVAKVLKRMGYIESYRWAFDGATAVNHVLNVGPVILGISWTEGMLDTDPNGFIRPTGQIVGGHAVLLYGVNTLAKTPDGRRGVGRILNSWGTGWGENGRCKIALEDLDDLIRDQGEACAIYEALKPVPIA